MDKEELEIRKEIQELTYLILIDPNNYKHYYKRGVLYGGEHIDSDERRETEYHGDHSRSIEDFDKVIELKPDFAIAYYHKACIYFDLDIDDNEAVCLVEQALNLEPNNSKFILKGEAIHTYHGE